MFQVDLQYVDILLAPLLETFRMVFISYVYGNMTRLSILKKILQCSQFFSGQ